MCYSAQVRSEHKKFQRETGAIIDIQAYVDMFWRDGGPPAAERRPRVPRALEIGFLRDGPKQIADLIRQWDLHETTMLEQDLFTQRRRVADAQRRLQSKITKKAEEDVRIGSAKIDQIKGRLSTLKRSDPKPADARIYPGHYCHVLVSEEGKRVLRPMRYQCRPAGKPASYDRRYPGTYNARRDNLEGFWKGQFGHTHGLLVADVFFENVRDEDDNNQVLAFTPRTGEPMLIACLWSHWTDPKGQAPDLYSFAAITDEPEPEVAAAGHDRTIINIKPEHVDAWLNPDPRRLDQMHAIFDDRQHPYYEHRKVA